VLGAGEFGLVCKGGIVSLDTLERTEVAVKTVKANATETQLMSILNELKVLSYLENGHNNVLHILGACTNNARYMVRHYN